MSIVQIFEKIISCFKSKKNNNKKNDIIHNIETRVKELECRIQSIYDHDMHDMIRNSQQQNFDLALRNFKLLSELIAEVRIVSRSISH